ncbi:alpha/beta fold hydrolase [Emticicia sp. BO119]|uniref:alpha/beta fold hydrolase n=1 Tax=Emticicia sp. BO119 TaxID=2757768 RepID=UPI0015F0E0C6|nr:alpha/beta hydrolase [Emticicia sp. BO119]MBA4849204.1 alpha/beta hydrolase [Emticicia sp. BO119]
MKTKSHLFLINLLFLLVKITYAQVKVSDLNLENYKYPFPVKYITINSQKQELQMAYMDVKPDKANGKVVMLLHGKNFNGAYWRQTTEVLTKAGYRVIIPDQIGFGKSSKPLNYQYSFQDLARNTKQILDDLGIRKLCVLGHSMGGMLATRFVLMCPDMVEKFILVNPIGLEDYKLKVPYQTIDEAYQKELKQTYQTLKKYQQTNYYDGQWKSAYEEWLAPLAGWTLNKDYSIIAWNSALTSDMIMTQPVAYEFDKIKTPTLLIIGQRDRTAIGKDRVSKELQATMGNYPELGKLTQAKIANSKLVPIEGVGHLPHIEAFDKFITPLLDFLNE